MRMNPKTQTCFLLQPDPMCGPGAAGVVSASPGLTSLVQWIRQSCTRLGLGRFPGRMGSRGRRGRSGQKPGCFLGQRTQHCRNGAHGDLHCLRHVSPANHYDHRYEMVYEK